MTLASVFGTWRPRPEPPRRLPPTAHFPSNLNSYYNGRYAHLLLGQPELTSPEGSGYRVGVSLGPSLKAEGSPNGAWESRPTFGE